MCENPRCRYIELQEDSRGNQVISHYAYDIAGNRILLMRSADAFKKGCISFSNHINNTKFDIDTFIDYEYIDVSGN
jgi:hypothetical protein